MPPRRISSAVSKQTNAIAGDAPIRVSKLPPFLRFPLLVVLSLTLSAMLYGLVPAYAKNDLAVVSRRLDRWWEVGVLVGYRTVELGLGWWGGFDGFDLVALTILGNGPVLYLLAAFYEVGPSTVLMPLGINCLTTYIPFRLLRPISLAHSASTTPSSSRKVTVPNQAILTDTPIRIFTTILPSIIYSVVLHLAFSTYLPKILAYHFNYIPTLISAYTSTFVTLFPLSLLAGLAARTFIFVPAAATVPTLADIKAKAFNPEVATLGETLRYNIWGYGRRTKMVLKRTAAAMLVSGVNTFVQTWVTVEGVEMTGALLYSGVFVLAAGVIGLALGVCAAV